MSNEVGDFCGFFRMFELFKKRRKIIDNSEFVVSGLVVGCHELAN